MKKSQFVEQLFTIRGKPFSFKGREMMRDMYDMKFDTAVFMMGRQVGKSVTLCNDMLTDCFLIPWFNTLFVTPRMEQTAMFSNDKLKPTIKGSPRFNKAMCDSSVMQNVFDKEFLNNSKIFLRSSFLTADSIRGISADKSVLDEVQDIIFSNVGIIEQVLSGSEYQIRLYAGTPKTHTNTLARLYSRSTKNEYLVRCRGCNKYNCLNEDNVGKKGVICKKCGKSLGPPFDGQWVSMNPKSTTLGFRLPQIISPTANWKRIMEIREEFPHYQFMNEILALPHDSGSNPITETDLMACCDPGRKNELPASGTPPAGTLVLGIDWGHGDLSLASKKKNAPTGYTVAVLARLLSNGVFEILWIKKFKGVESDPIHQIKELFILAKTQKTLCVGADHGGGFYHNVDLRKRLGDRPPLLEFNAHANVREKIKWDPEVDSNRVTFHRTRCMSEFFHRIKQGRLRLPQWEDFADFAPDFLTIFVDYRSGIEQDKIFYNHVLPDDTFHATMLAYLTAKFYTTYLV